MHDNEHTPSRRRRRRWQQSSEHDTPNARFALVTQIIEQLRTSGRVDRPKLGMRLVTVDAQETKDKGVMVSPDECKTGGWWWWWGW